jgi:two-component system, LytTR family, sensor kinase
MYRWLITFSIWNIIAVINTTRDAIYRYIKNDEFTWFDTAYLSFSNCWAWALLTPVIYLISIHFSISQNRAIRNVPILIIAGVVISSIHSFGSYALEFTIRDLAGHLGGKTVLEVIASIDRLTIPGILNSFIIFSVIVALIHGYKFYDGLQREKIINYKLEINLAQLRLHSLKSQLHPHFLFNALNTISTLIKVDPQKADHVLISLSELLRYSFSQLNQEKIKLKEEIYFIKKYLEIQQVRFEDKLSIELLVDEQLMNAQIPPLLLQPLVENALKHGIEPSHKAGILKINISEKQNSLHIQIKDNGIGFKSEVKYKIPGVGLTNTKERLLQIYGDGRSSFSITNLTQGGVDVCISLPLELNHQAT